MSLAMVSPTKPQLTEGAISAITERLSLELELPLPSSQYQGQTRPSSSSIQSYLQQLISRDPASFLERYGHQLQSQELAHFQPLAADYEVGFWLQQLKQAAGTAAHPSHLPATIKNRRLAAMQRLHQAGEYFSDEAMRHRQPLMYHQYIGQYLGDEQSGHGHDGGQDALQDTDNRLHHQGSLQGGTHGQMGQISGHQFSDLLIRQVHEADVRRRMQAEMDYEDEQLSEHDSTEEDESDSDDATDKQDDGTRQCSKQQPNAAQLVENRRLFIKEMEDRFLSGLDHVHVDYTGIDKDITLDDDWIEQAGRDAQEKYFDED